MLLLLILIIKKLPLDELMKYIKGPDFPTGGIIYGYQGVRKHLKLEGEELL